MSTQSLNLVVVGDATVGKTSLLLSYTNNNFPVDYQPTVFDTYSANMMCDRRVFHLSLWDTSGKEEYDRLRPLSYAQSNAFLLCYSVVDPASFQNVRNKWYPEVSHFAPSTPIILVGTKSDLRSDRKVVSELASKHQAPVSAEDAQNLAKEIGAKAYVESSALTQKSLNLVFEESIRTAFPSDKGALKKKKKPLNGKGCAIL